MGYVKLKPARVLNRDMAILFGAEATRPVAEKVEAKAKALADMKAKHSSVADRIDISTHAHGTHTAVIMSVTGRDVRKSPLTWSSATSTGGWNTNTASKARVLGCRDCSSCRKRNMSDPTIFDLSVREQLDAVAMTRAYLDAVEWKDRDFRPVIQPEVTPATDSLLLSHDVILYHCGAPEQPDWNLKAWIWQYTLSLTVLGRDPERVARICGWLHRCISAWPYRPGTDYGKIGRIVDNPGFESRSSGDMTSSKSIVAWTSTKRIQAASPRG